MLDTLRYLGVPEHMADRMQLYYDYMVNFTHPGPEGLAMLGNLPEPLYRDVCDELYVPLLQRVPVFKSKSVEYDFIIELAKRMRPYIYLPADYIFVKGQIGHGMYFLMAGTVQILGDRKGDVVAELTDGAFFGEIATLVTAERTASVKTLTHCDVAFLSRDDLVSVLKEYPQSAHAVWTSAYRLYGSVLTRNHGQHRGGPSPSGGSKVGGVVPLPKEARPSQFQPFNESPSAPEMAEMQNMALASDPRAQASLAELTKGSSLKKGEGESHGQIPEEQEESPQSGDQAALSQTEVFSELSQLGNRVRSPSL